MSGRLHRMIRSALEGTGLDWAITDGRRHHQVIIEGKRVMVFSTGCHPGKDIDKLKSAIRRAQEAKNANSGRAVQRA